MKFGKLDNVDGVNFEMPEDPQDSIDLLDKLPALQGPPNVYIGCTGWSMKEWVGGYYPQGTKAQNYLDEYAKQFNTIELNTTHYRIPDEQTIARWVEKTPAHFRFSPKLPQMISHSNDLAISNTYTQSFCQVIVGLGERLGTSFMQLPPHFGPDQLDLLELFLKKFPVDKVPLAIEIRHSAFFEQPEEMSKLNALLAHFGVGTVFSDVAGCREALHLHLTNATAMVRFVGNDLHPSDYERVDAWMERLQLWIEKGLENIYFFHHQPENILAPDMAEYFIKKMNERCGLSLAVPNKHQDQQLSLF